MYNTYLKYFMNNLLSYNFFLEKNTESTIMKAANISGKTFSLEGRFLLKKEIIAKSITNM